MSYLDIVCTLRVQTYPVAKIFLDHSTIIVLCCLSEARTTMYVPTTRFLFGKDEMWNKLVGSLEKFAKPQENATTVIVAQCRLPEHPSYTAQRTNALLTCI